MPIKVKPPYDEFAPKASPTTAPSAPTVNGSLGSSRATPVPRTTPAGQGEGQYPSLPNVGNYQPPRAGDTTSSQQQYPQPTYPGQQQYQQAGLVYPDPTATAANEHSKLLP